MPQHVNLYLLPSHKSTASQVIQLSTCPAESLTGDSNGIRTNWPTLKNSNLRRLQVQTPEMFWRSSQLPLLHIVLTGMSLYNASSAAIAQGSSRTPSTPLHSFQRQLVDDVFTGVEVSEEQRERLRSIFAPSADGEARPQSPVPPADPTVRDSSELSFARTVDGILQGGQFRPSVSLHAYVDDQEEPPGQQIFRDPQPPIEVLTSSSWPSISYARELVRCFNRDINSSMFIIGESEIEGLIQSVYGAGPQSAPRISICQLCMIFSLGAQAIDNRDATIFWFENGRRYLDELLNDVGERNFWTARVFFMVSMYYCAHKRTAARIYLELAVRAAQHHKGDLTVGEEYLLWRTLIMLDRYLSQILGKTFIIADSDARLYMQPLIDGEAGQLSLRDGINLLMFITGRLVTSIYPTKMADPPPTSIYESCARQLNDWMKMVRPEFANLLGSAAGALPTWNIQIYRALATYYYTGMIVYRPALEQLVLHVVGITQVDGSLATISQYAERCVRFAREMIHVTHGYLRQGDLVKPTAMSVYIIFQAFLVTVLDATHRAHADETSNAGDQFRGSSSPLLDLDMAIIVLESYAGGNTTATLCSKVCRSMRRNLQSYVAGQLGGKGKGLASAAGSQYAQSADATGFAPSGRIDQDQVSALFAGQEFDYPSGFDGTPQGSEDPFNLVSLDHFDPNFVPNPSLGWGTLPFDPDVAGFLDPSNLALSGNLGQQAQPSDSTPHAQHQNPSASQRQSGQSSNPQYQHHQQQQQHRRR
ncbi:MAG: hypothetical protein M1812_007673 [Candelaria pacifica]|nr:MAG: hypothetical protein M1812_007673 [Candelaria pacifica]